MTMQLLALIAAGAIIAAIVIGGFVFLVYADGIECALFVYGVTLVCVAIAAGLAFLIQYGVTGQWVAP